MCDRIRMNGTSKAEQSKAMKILLAISSVNGKSDSDTKCKIG